MRLNKSLGQHFLIDQSICQKIATTILQLPVEKLVEIGPGAGAISEYFVTHKTPDNYIAFEIDLEKINILKQKFPTHTNCFIHQDILQSSKPFNEKFCIAGNFPYNISSQILFKTLEWKYDVSYLVGMFQKEVAERIAAAPNSKDYGILSVLMQTYFKTEILFDIDPSSFNPPPKVNSSIVLLTRKATDLDIDNYTLYAKIIKTTFQQRRKQLRNTLSLLIDKKLLIDDFYNKRPENLNVEDFFSIYKIMKKQIAIN